ncbi:hypothetical protein ACFQ0B_62795 [Nonomuraea thailandensis]
MGGEEDVVNPVVHSHSWDLHSHVLAGTVLNERIAVSPRPEHGQWQVYQVKVGDEADEIAPAGGLVGHVTTALDTIRRGEQYHLPAGAYHRNGHRGAAATVVLGVPRPGVRDTVLGPPGQPPRSERREVLSRQAALRALEPMLAAIERAGDAPA